MEPITESYQEFRQSKEKTSRLLDWTLWVIMARLRERGLIIGYTQAGRYRKALKDNIWINKEETK